MTFDPRFRDAIFMPYVGAISVYSEYGGLLTTIDVEGDTGYPTGGWHNGSGFAFLDNYTKLIVPAGPNGLDWYSVNVDESTFAFNYEGNFVATGYHAAWILQSQANEGFAVLGADSVPGGSSRASSVTSSGSITNTVTNITRSGWVLGTSIYFGDNQGAGTYGIYRKDILSNDPDFYGSWEAVFITPSCQRYQAGDHASILRGGNHWMADLGPTCSGSFFSEVTAGGTPTGRSFAVTGAWINGDVLSCPSYLYEDRAYTVHNTVTLGDVYRLHTVNTPFTVNQFAVGSSLGPPDNPIHCYKYPISVFPPPTPTNKFPGLSRYKASDASEEIFTRT